MVSTRTGTIAWMVLVSVLVLGLLSLLSASPAFAQATASTGNIQGTILDPNGAVVTTAKVTITNKDTGQKITPEVTSSGTYTSGPVLPGQYVVRVTAEGFKTIEQTVKVEVGVIGAVNIALQLGSESTVIMVEGTAVSVNTEQASVQGVLTTKQIESLPIQSMDATSWTWHS